MSELPKTMRGGATGLERITVSHMGSNHRIATIADHVLAARRLALAEDEPFLVMLLDMLLIPDGPGPEDMGRGGKAGRFVDGFFGRFRRV